MKVDTTNTRYREIRGANRKFDRAELKHLRTLLRRLHFLEFRVEQNGGVGNAVAHGAMYAEWEMLALEHILLRLEFLAPQFLETPSTTQREVAP